MILEEYVRNVYNSEWREPGDRPGKRRPYAMLVRRPDLSCWQATVASCRAQDGEIRWRNGTAWSNLLDTREEALAELTAEALRHGFELVTKESQ